MDEGLPDFETLARDEAATLDVLALALAGAFREVDADGALARLDGLGAELVRALPEADGDPEAEATACSLLLGRVHRFAGDRKQYDRPENSMLDVVLERRRGLPILLSVVYAEVARRAGIPIRGVGLPGHFVVAHFGTDPPVLLDPFNGGRLLAAQRGAAVTAWTPHETAMRMLNNLVLAYERRADLAHGLRAAELRLALPSPPDRREALEAELRSMRARLN